MKTILIPSDFSKNSSTALRYALRLLNTYGGKIILFHCSHVPANILMEANSPSAKDLLYTEDAREKKLVLQKQLERALKQVGMDTVPSGTKLVVESNPFVVENIIEVAERYKASLIVTGTHGATGLQKFFFGSNTSELISKSTVPVLAIPEQYRFREVERIVFSTDLHDFKNELKQILPFAQSTDAAIHVLYMDYGPHITQSHLKDAEKIIAKSSYKNIVLNVRNATIEVPLLKQINEEVPLLKPHWVVMFTRERSFWDKIFHKSKTEKMTYSLKYPLLSFRKQ